MKKIILTVAAVAALVSCSNDEVMVIGNSEAITFDQAFVDNATRAAYDGSYTTATLEEFQVYATITGADANKGEGIANIFNAERVVKGNSLGRGTNWSYAESNTQYWIPGNTYNFRAIAEGNVTNVTEVVAPADGKYMATAINLLDASAQKDILFAEDLDVVYTADDGAKVVKFTFNHILSKAKFTVKNTITTNNGYSYKVSNLKITNAVKNGVYTFDNSGAGTWAAASTPATYTLEFGHAVVTGTTDGADAADIVYGAKVESNYDRLLVPGTGALSISYDYQLLKDGIVIDTQEGQTITTNALTLLAGHAYNFVISLGNPGEPITFDLEAVNGWDTDGTADSDDDDTENDHTPIN